MKKDFDFTVVDAILAKHPPKELSTIAVLQDIQRSTITISLRRSSRMLQERSMSARQGCTELQHFMRTFRLTRRASTLYAVVTERLAM